MVVVWRRDYGQVFLDMVRRYSSNGRLNILHKKDLDQHGKKESVELQGGISCRAQRESHLLLCKCPEMSHSSLGYTRG